jgi:hypothetical protein
MYKQRKKVSHKLSKVKNTHIFDHIVFVDTETQGKHSDHFEGQIQEFMLGVAKYVRYDQDGSKIGNDDYLYFDSLPQFYEWLLDIAYKVKTLRVYAHNMDFDFSVLNVLHYMDEYGFTLDDFIIDSGNFLFEFVQSGTHVIFTDTAMYFHQSVQALGKYLQFPKLQMPSYYESLDKWYTYCQRDVDVIERMYTNYVQFLVDYDLGTQGYTIASQAFHAFRHRFMRDDIYIHAIDSVISDERAAYHGGRTEPFYLGEVQETPIYDLDVNSLYPYVMQKYAYPTKYLTSYEQPTLHYVKEMLKSYSAVALCELNTENNIYPYQSDKLIFPIGNFLTWLNTGEILEAIERGDLVDIRLIHFYQQAHIFDDYIAFFYELKRQATHNKDGVKRFMAKLFQNSLYGKFGQKTYEVIPIDERAGIDYGIDYVVLGDTGKLEYRYIINGIEYAKGEPREGFDSFVAIASNVTAYARLHLYHLIERAGKENVYYCDTDSVFVNTTGYENLKDELDDEKLGKLKIEKVFNNLTINGPKDYKGDDLVKLKGVPKKARRLSDGVYQYTHFTRFRERLRRGVSGGVLTEQKVKRLARNYDKATVLPSGRCIPFRLS